jgi:hypothetical protein
MDDTKHIFISYSRRDTKSVDRIVEALHLAGYSAWIDRSGILGGSLWKRDIVVAIRDSNAFVIVLSPYSVASDNVRKELDLSQLYRKQVVPLLIAETAIPDEMQYQLIGIQQVAWNSFEEGSKELCGTLKSLNIERLDLPGDAGVLAEPILSWRQEALGIFGLTAALAAAIVYAVAGLIQKNAAVPLSLTPLMPMSLFAPGGTGFFSLGLFAILALLGIVFEYSKSLRPAVARLAAFFLLTIPLAFWKGQYITASLGVIAALAVGAWWSRRPKSGAGQASMAVHALILLGSVVLGATTQYLLAREPDGRSVIGVTPFEVVGDEALERKKVDLSNRLLLKLSAVFSRAGFQVVPREGFKEENLNDWSFDNWRVEKARQVEPRLLLRTTLRQCGFHALPGDPRPTSYTWFAEPYSPDLEPLLDFASASGSDTRVLSFRIAFKLLAAAPNSVGLSKEQRAAAIREIVKDVLTVARSGEDMAEQAQAAISLLAQPAMDEKKVLELLNSFTTDDNACDETAAKNRNANKKNVISYSEGGS